MYEKYCDHEIECVASRCPDCCEKRKKIAQEIRDSAVLVDAQMPVECVSEVSHLQTSIVANDDQFNRDGAPEPYSTRVSNDLFKFFSTDHKMLGRILLFDVVFTDAMLYALWNGYLLPLKNVRQTTYEASVQVAAGVTGSQAIFASPAQLTVITFYLSIFTLAILIP